MHVTRWPGIERVSPDFLSGLAEAARAKNWSLDDLLAHISIESGFRPDAGSNSSTAGGLIQMIDATARRYLGASAQQVRKMSDFEQLPGIVKYFDIGAPLSGADFRILGFSRNPALLGKPDSTVVYPAGSAASRVNPTFTDASGAITLGAIRSHFDGFKARNASNGLVELSAPSSAGGGVAIMLLLGLGAGYALLRR